jgi:flagellar protein FliO/FliZ
MTYGFSSLLWFVAILALIPVALWLLKRTPAVGGSAHGLMRTLATLPLAPNQRLVAVEVGTGDERRWLVLGITPHNITTLHSMAPQADVPAAAPAQVPFAQLMARLGQRKGDGGAR